MTSYTSLEERGGMDVDSQQAMRKRVKKKNISQNRTLDTPFFFSCSFFFFLLTERMMTFDVLEGDLPFCIMTLTPHYELLSLAPPPFPPSPPILSLWSTRKNLETERPMSGIDFSSTIILQMDLWPPYFFGSYFPSFFFCWF